MPSVLHVNLLSCCKGDGRKRFEHPYAFWPPDLKVLTFEKNFFTKNELKESKDHIGKEIFKKIAVL